MDENQGRPVLNTYPAHGFHWCIDAYVEPKDADLWLPCPRCGLKPRVWVYNNGRVTACGCWLTTYNHFTVSAESIMSYLKRTGSTEGYKFSTLREHWNAYCRSGVACCTPQTLRQEGRW